MQLFTWLQVCLCLLIGLSSIIQALPIIILYQSFGVGAAWVVLWCFWWSLPLWVLFRLTTDQSQSATGYSSVERLKLMPERIGASFGDEKLDLWSR